MISAAKNPEISEFQLRMRHTQNPISQQMISKIENKMTSRYSHLSLHMELKKSIAMWTDHKGAVVLFCSEQAKKIAICDVLNF